MLGNLAAKLILEKDDDDEDIGHSGQKYVFNQEISPLLDVMEKFENKLVRKNGLRALAIFCEKLDAWMRIKRKKLTKFLRDVILFDSDVDNIFNSLTVLAIHVGVMEMVLLKKEGFLVQLIALLRFLNHLNFNLNILQEGRYNYDYKCS